MTLGTESGTIGTGPLVDLFGKGPPLTEMTRTSRRMRGMKRVNGSSVANEIILLGTVC